MQLEEHEETRSAQLGRAELQARCSSLHYEPTTHLAPTRPAARCAPAAEAWLLGVFPLAVQRPFYRLEWSLGREWPIQLGCIEAGRSGKRRLLGQEDA